MKAITRILLVLLKTLWALFTAAWVVAVLALIAAGLWFLGPVDYAKSLIDYQRIAGRWERPLGPGCLEFRADGTVRDMALLSTSNGTFKLLPENRLEWEAAGMLWGTNTCVFRWQREGDVLHLGLEGSPDFLWRLKRL